MSDGTVLCWGQNVYGGLGSGTGGQFGPGFNGHEADSPWPVKVLDLTDATQVSTSGGNSCAALLSGIAKCWGYGAQGANGDGTLEHRGSPVSVVGITNATQVEANGGVSACALLSSGSVKCWGSNGVGQLGDGSTTTRISPVSVGGITTATQISMGSDTACVVLAAGTVKCWGDNQGGGLGDGTTINSSSPVSVVGITTAIQVSVGNHSSCALLSGGTVKCWGYNYSGQLGDGSTTTSSSPVSVGGITTATQVSAGGDKACAVLADGTIKCWGTNGAGALGDDTTVGWAWSDYSATPVTVVGITNATQVSSGSNRACAVLSDGTAKCWGAGGGTQGDGTYREVNKKPVFVRFPDTTAPTAPGSFTGVPSAQTQMTDASVGFTLGESDGTVECRVDSGSWGACTSVDGTSGSKAVSGLADGSHAISVRQTDAAGNTSSIGTSASWTVDTTAPGVPAVTAGSIRAGVVRPAISFAPAEANGTFECKLDAGDWVACASPFVPTADLAVGTYTLRVRQTDAAVNVSDAASFDFAVTPPFAAVTFVGAPTWFMVGHTGHFQITAPVSTGGDERGGAQAMTVQLSNVAHPDSRLPSRASHNWKVLRYSESFTWNHNYRLRPRWIRVGTKGGKWTAWTPLVIRSQP